MKIVEKIRDVAYRKLGLLFRRRVASVGFGAPAIDVAEEGTDLCSIVEMRNHLRLAIVEEFEVLFA